INSIDELRASEFSEVEAILNKSERKDYRYVQYKKQYESQFKAMGTAEIIASVTAEKATVIIPFQDDAHINMAAVKEFLEVNRENLKSDISSYATYFRKLACLIDRVEFGF
ncbi:hypothetical protein CU665_26790, partial [Pseudomonas syringae pv. actinidifoliorum]|nr:hypothetical protein [Pseudomonas syringae pv. actinidifoliorum]